MIRHWAFFDQHTGAWVREWKGPVSTPSRMVAWLRWTWLRNKWATLVSAPLPGEVGIDVTQYGYPVGDFRYCTFDCHDRRLEWGPPRYYLECDEVTGQIVANWESPRPLAMPRQGRCIYDITGTALEVLHGRIYGQLSLDGGRVRISPSHDLSDTLRLQLIAASHFDDYATKAAAAPTC